MKHFEQIMDIELLPLTTSPPKRNSKHCSVSTLKQELWLLTKLTVPLAFSAAVEYGGKVLTTLFAGSILSTKEFDAVALGNTMTNITGYLMILAFASPMDSLCTQANGAHNWKLFSVTVHRVLFCSFLLVIPTVILWLNIEKILILCGQDPNISYNVYRWTLVYIAILPAYIIRTVLARFLSSQGIGKPLFWISISTFIIWHPLWLCVVFKWFRCTDFLWFPSCNVVTTYVQIVLSAGYIWIVKPHEPLTLQRVSISEVFQWKRKYIPVRAELVPSETTSNDSNEAFSRINTKNMEVIDNGFSEYLHLTFAGMFSMCGEWWSWEVMTVLAGLLGSTQLAADVIYSTLIPLLVPHGIGLAGASRIGTLIGENRYFMARKVGDSVLWISFIVSILLSVVSFIFREYIPQMFTSNEDVIRIAVNLSPFYCSFMFIHGMQSALQGVLRGIKRQGRSAYAVLIGPWLISIPLACLFAFHPSIDWEIYGLWAGNNVGYYVMDGIFLYLWVSFEWKRE